MAMQLISKFIRLIFLIWQKAIILPYLSTEYSTEFVFDLEESLIGDMLNRKTNNIGIII